MAWVDKGGRFSANLPSGAIGGHSYKIQIKDNTTGKVVTRSAYRTSERWGYLQDFKLNMGGKVIYLTDLLDVRKT
jgi:hypothetical protein